MIMPDFYEITDGRLKDNLLFDRNCLIQYEICYPKIVRPDHTAINTINNFSEYNAKNFESYVKTGMYSTAIRLWGMEENTDLFPLFAGCIYQTMFQSKTLLSFKFHMTECTEEGKKAVFTKSSTWFTANGMGVKLEDLFRVNIHYKEMIIYHITMHIKEMIAENRCSFREEWTALLLQKMNWNNFYLCPEGIVVYYQRYELSEDEKAPWEFLIQYRDLKTQLKTNLFL